MTEQPIPAPDAAPEDVEAAKSIVDTILDLDALLSADVRRATGVAYLYARADLEARLDELEEELKDAVDREAIVGTGEKSVGERSSEAIKAEREELRRQYAASRIAIPVEQMTSDEWADFQHKHKDALSGAFTIDDLPVDVANELIAKSMVTTSPATVEQVAAMRRKFGGPQVARIAARAWQVNEHSGVSVPK